MKEQRSEFRLINEWWMFCIVSLSLIKSTKLLTCLLSCWPTSNASITLYGFTFIFFGDVNICRLCRVCYFPPHNLQLSTSALCGVIQYLFFFFYQKVSTLMFLTLKTVFLQNDRKNKLKIEYMALGPGNVNRKRQILWSVHVPKILPTRMD